MLAQKSVTRPLKQTNFLPRPIKGSFANTLKILTTILYNQLQDQCALNEMSLRSKHKIIEHNMEKDATMTYFLVSTWSEQNKKACKNRHHPCSYNNHSCY